MAKADLNRLIENLKSDPKLVENFKGVGNDLKAFVSKGKSLGYNIDQKDVDSYVEARKGELSSKVKSQAVPPKEGANLLVNTLNEPSPIIFAPAQVVAVVVGPVNVVGPLNAVVAQYISVS